MLRVGIARALALAVGLAVASPAVADMGRLEDFLPKPGQDDPWRFDRPGGGFVMENGADASALSYYYVNPRPGAEGKREIAVDVAFGPGADGVAGLLYGFDPADRSYFMFVLDPAGMVSFYRRDKSGFKQLLQSEMPNIRPDVNRLTIREAGREATLLLNGEKVSAMSINGLGRGGAGVVAGGKVHVRFDRFSIGAPGAGAAPKTQDWSAKGRKASATGASTPSAAATAATAAPPPLRLRPVEIVDDKGPVGRMRAYTALIPADWETKGGVAWNPPTGCFTGARLVWGAGSKDKSTGVALFPPITWAMSNQGRPAVGCVPADLQDAEAVARKYLASLPDVVATVERVERPPELQAMVRQMSAATPPPVAGRQWQDGVMLRARTRVDGVEAETAVIVLSHHYEIATPDGWGRGGMIVTRGGASATPIVISMPVGQFDLEHPGVVAVLSNLKADPAWMNAVAQWHARQRQAALAARRNAPATTSGGGQSVGDMMFESWKRREGMKDAGQAKLVHGIHETRRFHTPNGQVTLSQNYNHTWRLKDGTYVQTDDAHFNPVQTFGQFGERLRPVQ